MTLYKNGAYPRRKNGFDRGAVYYNIIVIIYSIVYATVRFSIIWHVVGLELVTRARAVRLFYLYLQKNLNASRLDLLSIPQSSQGGKHVKTFSLGGIIGCKCKTSSCHLIGFPDGINSNIGSTV